MAPNLNRTLSWKAALGAGTPQDTQDLAMLVDMQGNILKGHGRKHTANIFLRFSNADAGKKFLSSIGRDVPSALDQLMGTHLHKAIGADGGLFLAALLSAAGYEALGLQAKMPSDDPFSKGMGARQELLADPAKSTWDKGFDRDVHCMVLLGVDDPKGWAGKAGATRDSALVDIRTRIGSFAGVSIAAVEVGDALFNKDDGNGIEHFGYVDGRSQPLMLDEDLASESATKWDPRIPLSQVLLQDPGGALDVSCGSYFVFRKLEQDVAGFKSAESSLAATLKMVEPDDERAGASVVGRFENGTPVVVSKVEIPLGGDKTVSNDFNYDNDPSGLRCPFAGHIRKSNPREFGTKDHLMARRGIPFGLRTDDPNDGRIDNKPSGGVGLLFMAYQSDLANQFEFTQNAWVDNPNFNSAGAQPVGIDPVIGQGAKADMKQRYPSTWGALPLSEPQAFGGFVKMRGGEYFFAPSLSFFKHL